MPIANHYEWDWGGPLPLLARHSAVKHSLLRQYLVQYFLTLVSSPRQDRIQLTIVDGFSGGGRYVTESGERVPGSPLVILKALAEAKARIEYEQHRIKPIDLDVELICVDESVGAIDHLRHVLEEEGYGERLGNESIRLLRGDFVTHAEAIIAQACRRSPRAGRALFVLDQYGYSAVPIPTLNTIFAALSHAEVILTFNVDSLLNYLSFDNARNFERKTGLVECFTVEDLETEIRGSAWRLKVQSQLYRRITTGSGATHFTPFFIRPYRGHGDFWLLHLSKHWRARDVMAGTHWEHQNHFVHYGTAGFDMLGAGYAARIDDEGSDQTAFNFDDVAHGLSLETMREQIPIALSAYEGGVTFEQFFLERVNTTPATRDMVEKAILDLVSSKEVQVLGDEGRRVAKVRKALDGNHVLLRTKQRSFLT